MEEKIYLYAIITLFYEKSLPSERHETLAFHDVSETFVECFTRKRINNPLKIACNDPTWEQLKAVAIKFCVS